MNIYLHYLIKNVYNKFFLLLKLRILHYKTINLIFFIIQFVATNSIPMKPNNFNII